MLPTDICFQVVLTVTGDLCPCHISLFQSVLRLGCIFFANGLSACTWLYSMCFGLSSTQKMELSPPQKLCSVFTCGQGKPGFWLAMSNLFTFIFFSSVRLCHTLSPLLVPLWLRLANICIQLGLESPPVDIKSFTPTLNGI